MDEPALVIKSVEFVKSAVRPEHYPPDDLPEVAFAGRSNVGKSSLINCLVQRKKLVRTSRTPGQTQTINFFKVNGTCYFVDLPGYGFARVPEKIRQQWGPMMEAYLTTRKSLKGIVLILDIRHPPTADDVQLWTYLNGRGIPVIPVLTKADKVVRGKWRPHSEQAAEILGLPTDDFIVFSAETRQGRDALLVQVTKQLIPESDAIR